VMFACRALVRSSWRFRPTTLPVRYITITEQHEAQAEEKWQQILAEAKQKTAAVINSVPPGGDYKAIWEKETLPNDVDVSFLYQDPAEMLKQKPLSINEIAALDHEGVFAPVLAKYEEEMKKIRAIDIGFEAFVAMGGKPLEYRRDGVEIDWDYYRKEIGDTKLVDFLEQKCKETVESYDKSIAEGSPFMKEVEESKKRLEELFIEKIKQFQQIGQAVVQEVEHTKKKHAELVDTALRLEEVYIAAELATNPDLDHYFEEQLLEGNWSVDDDDIPEPPPDADDNYEEFKKLLTLEYNEKVEQEKFRKAIMG